uniref:Uncharacterized protein n=1 Tax=Aliivibrio fischeri TaxID=668 RepID=H2ESB3_ALIFS|nr:hypothetical protein [Aliivibrio fischeri]
MCDKQKYIEELEQEKIKLLREMSNAYKYNIEMHKLSIKECKLELDRHKRLMDSMISTKDRVYQAILLIMPLIISLIALFIALVKQ